MLDGFSSYEELARRLVDGLDVWVGLCLVIECDPSTLPSLPLSAKIDHDMRTFPDQARKSGECSVEGHV